MKNKLLMLIIFITMTIIMIPSLKATSFDYGTCIENYGTITYVSAGNDNANISDHGNGNINYKNEENNKTWGDPDVPVTFDFVIQASKNHYITNIYYRVGNCNGEITGFDPTDNYSSYEFSVKIDKGYVKKFTAWGMQQKDGTELNDRLKTGINKESVNVKFYSQKTTTTTSGGASGPKQVKCVEFSELLNRYWTMVIIIMPILTILLIAVDLLKVIISSDPDTGGGDKGSSKTLKKVGNDAIKRMIALVILLILPFIVRTIFGWFGINCI